MAKEYYKNLRFSPDDIRNQTYKRFFGGGAEQWDKRGSFQLNILKKLGLKPQSMFLDIGCGPLRGGVHFIDYLDTGLYHGVDSNDDLVNAGKKAIEEENLAAKKPTVETVLDFKFGNIGPFDCALAFSVLGPKTAGKCFAELQSVMKVGGKIYVSHAKWFQKWRKPRGLKYLCRWFRKSDVIEGLPWLKITNWIQNIKQVDANFDMSNFGWEQDGEPFPVVELTVQGKQ